MPLPTVTKADFIKDGIMPANDDDKFNDNRCAYCWGSYDADHPAVRVLPCNHVFGKDCLLEVIETSKTGDLCMVCRQPLFRRPLWRLISDLLIALALPIGCLCLVVVYVSLWGWAYYYALYLFRRANPIFQHVLFWAMAVMIEWRPKRFTLAISYLLFYMIFDEKTWASLEILSLFVTFMVFHWEDRSFNERFGPYRFKQKLLIIAITISYCTYWIYEKATPEEFRIFIVVMSIVTLIDYRSVVNRVATINPPEVD